ncbi:hypothetical protein BK133_12275 [Paenibacillus sp. FSL H8-0548]|uniref:response regulator transcription factor n=1 Tax=Paenibacillus sp. FSL H8-0548 TaxID=1920422 RepID=UPI00096FE256|nr:response regulator [Paenibacillus sp. FSL H8-0548]OMF34568.1 hypothetical protein BK133_12275 [Paenibacillus sp. FSL H8-0548]
MKMILADDEVLSLQLMEHVIDWRSIGIEIAGLAMDGLEALALIKNKMPDLLLTDIRMPNMDGMELIRQALRIKPDLHIVIISAYAEFELAQEAIRQGAKDYLLKPLDEAVLLTLVMRIRQQWLEQIEREKEQTKLLRIAQEREMRDRLYVPLLIQHGNEMIAGRFRLTVIQAENVTYSGHIRWEQNASDLSDSLKASFSKSLGAFLVKELLFEHHPGEWVAVVSSKATDEQIRQAAEEALINTGLIIVVGISGERDDLQEMPPAYHEALAAIKKRTTEQTGPIFSYLERGDQNPLIQQAKQYMMDHFNTDLSLEQICEKVNVSKNYFSTLFKKETGKNVWDFLSEYRTERAKELLVSTHLKNYEIALEIGYENPSYFTKTFKKWVGIGPQEYRLQHGRKV